MERADQGWMSAPTPGNISGSGNGGDASGSPAFSGHTFDVVAGALHRVAARVDEAGPKQAEAARLIRLGEMNAAFPVMSECIGLWQEVQGALAAAATAIGQPVERLAELVLTPTGEAARAPLTELAGALQCIKRAVEGRDWIGLADALEYDLGELAQRWRTALVLADESDGAAPASAAGMRRSAPAA
jgi:hypothetical protein